MKFYKIFSSLVLLFVTASQLIAQDQSPTVENVMFSQRTDGTFIVDVYYDVNDPEGNTMTVTMQVSSDNGVTWDFGCNNITGDIGSGITSGTNWHIVWDFGAEHPQTFGDQFRIKIIADDGGIVMGIPCPDMPKVYYEGGPYNDTGGDYYNTVLIGEQCWLRENMNIGTRIDGSLDQTSGNGIEKYCYDNLESNCDIYGGLYQWNEAMQYVTTEEARGICPEGWHIPSLAEFQTLATAVGDDGNALKAVGQDETSTNTSGFSALMAGRRYDDGYFYYLGYYTYFWSSTEMIDIDVAFSLTLGCTYSLIDLYGYYYKEDGFSIRCLKD